MHILFCDFRHSPLAFCVPQLARLCLLPPDNFRKNESSHGLVAYFFRFPEMSRTMASPFQQEWVPIALFHEEEIDDGVECLGAMGNVYTRGGRSLPHHTHRKSKRTKVFMFD
jgi:hypothetical protein